MKGLLAGLGMALRLGACAGPAPAPALRSPPLPYPPSAAQRVVRIALAEWQDWGSREREAAARPAGEAGPPPESQIGNFPRVLAYWRAVEYDERAIQDNRRRYAALLAGAARDGTALWAEPAWSAAFVSWVFRSAGVDAREFPPNATHSLYLDGLIADALAFPALAPFLPHAPEEHAPAPGDLLCLDRSRAPLRHWRERLAETGVPRPMHCDIVTGTAPGVVEAVGGNVGDSVTLTRFPTDEAGRLLPAPPGRLPILLVMESRLGRLPPWGDGPAVLARR